MPPIHSDLSDTHPARHQAVPAWITPELIEKTIQLWSKRSGTVVTRDEAIGILLRVGTLLDVLTR